MNNTTDMYELLKKSDVILEGHFKLTSGRHSNVYINKDSIYRKYELFSTTISEMINKILHSGINFDIITGPAIAGAILAAPLSIKMKKTFVYSEKIYEAKKVYDMTEVLMWPETEKDRRYTYKSVSDRMEFRRGYDKVLDGKRVFIIEDVITTGGSIEKTNKAIRDNGGIVVGVISIWNRSGWRLNNCENLSLINRPVESWEPDKCPLCNDPNNRIPLRDPKIFQ